MIGALAVVGAVLATCAREALHWVGRPFAGLLFADNLIVVSIGRASWRDAALRRTEWSRIVAVDGVPLGSAQEAHRAIAATPLGERLTYTFRRGGEAFRVAIPVRTFTWADFRDIFAPMLAIGSLIALTGTVLLALRPELPEVRALFAICISFGLTLITGPDQYGPYRFTPLYLIALAAVPPAILHLAAAYPWQPGRWAMRAVAGAYALFAIVGGLLVALRFDPGVFLPLLYLVYFALANALLLYAGSLVGALATERRRRLQLAIALAAVVGSSALGGLVLVTYPLMAEPIAPAWLIFPVALMPILSGVAFVGVPDPGARAREVAS